MNKLDNVEDSVLKTWYNNKNVNPLTKRKITETGRIYKNYVNEYNKRFNQMIDPILFIELPVIPNKPIFEFKYKWDPYTGERLGIADKSLFFDPDTLIRMFYMNRLNHLWVSDHDSDNVNYLYDGRYGDATGNGYDFNITSRGAHPEWYVFRIPDVDTYLPEEHNLQIPTMTPKLTTEEILIIYKMAIQYNNNYLKQYNKQRPNLILMFQYYEDAINPTPVIPLTIIENEADIELKSELCFLSNQKAVELLKYL